MAQGSAERGVPGPKSTPRRAGRTRVRVRDDRRPPRRTGWRRRAVAARLPMFTEVLVALVAVALVQALRRQAVRRARRSRWSRPCASATASSSTGSTALGRARRHRRLRPRRDLAGALACRPAGNPSSRAVRCVRRPHRHRAEQHGLHGQAGHRAARRPGRVLRREGQGHRRRRAARRALRLRGPAVRRRARSTADLARARRAASPRSRVPADNLLVLGDHRSQSADSVIGCRGATDGQECVRLVPVGRVVGPVVLPVLAARRRRRYPG